MTVDQWVAAIIAVVSGIAFRLIDRYWPDLGKKPTDSSEGTASSSPTEV